MHPNVRGNEGSRCGDCGMALVPIPDRTVAEYWLDVEPRPQAIRAGRAVRLRIALRDRATGAPVMSVDEVHERPMHLFVVSHDLRHFDHVHPTPAADGIFEIALTLPRPGAYRLVADVLPTGGSPQTLQHTLVTAGAPAPLARVAPASDGESLEAVDAGVRARLVPKDARVGGDAHVRMELLDAKTGRPVDDLELYLGAWGHMLLAHEGLEDIVHSHPLIDETSPGGPTITFQTLFARAGWYRVWAQVQRGGRLLTFGFTVRVAPVA